MNAKHPNLLVILAALGSFMCGQIAWAQTMEELSGLEKDALRLIEAERTVGKNADDQNPYAYTAPDGSYNELAYIVDGTPVFRKTANMREAEIIGVVPARRHQSVSGRDVTIGLWDNGRAYRHAEFTDRLTAASQPGAFPGTSHATHVAGTLAATGLDIEATGIAPEASLVSYDWRSDYVEMWKEAQDGLRVSNHSYAFATGWEKVPENGSFRWTFGTFGEQFGEYGVTAWFWDDVMNQNPYYLPVKAAGNEAGQGPATGTNVGHYHNHVTQELHFDNHTVDCGSGYGCLGSVSTSKNALVVGALDRDGLQLADFSSRGPTLDGRLKPDVVSAGTGVYSSIGTADYGVSSGTSMAAPTIAGSVALMVELEKRLFGEEGRLTSSTLKGLLIHGADDLGAPGPDYQYGWGRVNVDKTLELMVASTGSRVAILEPDVAVEETFEFTTTGDDFVATLTWIDPIGANPNTVTDKTRPVLVEDIDLVVEQDGTVYYPFVLDPNQPDAPATRGVNSLDNVEQVRIEGLRSGSVRVSIRRKSPSTDPIRVSLVVSGISDQAIPTGSSMEVPTSASPMAVFPNPARAGSVIRVTGTGISIGGKSARFDLIDATGRIAASFGELLIDGSTLELVVPSHLASGLYFVRMSSEEVNRIVPTTITR